MIRVGFRMDIGIVWHTSDMLLVCSYDSNSSV